MFTELQSRGVRDCFVACVDGLKGLPEALETIFPHTQVQLCVVHKVRQSLRYVVWKKRRSVARDLRAMYGAGTVAEAEQAFTQFAKTWDAKYPTISASWRRDWERLTVFFGYPPEIRKVIYTTNAIESLNYSLYSLRKVLRAEAPFPPMNRFGKSCFSACSRLPRNGRRRFQSGSSP